ILFGAPASALLLGPILIQLNQTGTVYVPIKDIPTAVDLRANVPELRERTRIEGPQARDDGNSYFIWYHTDNTGNAQKYLVNDQGVPVYHVDPGINGTVEKRPDGTSVPKFDAPKATLMSYIIKGILDRKLPWGLVLLGVMITLMLEASGVPALAFAVGVYLPLSTSLPIFIGGGIRWLVDLYLKRKLAHRDLTPEQFAAETDKSPGVLMASGYIAGGAIAGILIAFLAGVTVETNRSIETWASTRNPFFSGDYASLLSVIPFIVLCAILYMTGREMILKSRKAG
ncbi:MAG: OPT/YSL family transporter, partial [Acidobacteriota bacterium]